MVDLGHADEFLIVCVYRTKTAESHGSARYATTASKLKAAAHLNHFFLLCG